MQVEDVEDRAAGELPAGVKSLPDNVGKPFFG